MPQSDNQTPYDSNNSQPKKQMSDYLADINQQFKEQEIRTKAKTFGLQYVNLMEFAINTDVLRHIKKDDAERIGLMPFYQVGKTIKIAFVDPQKNESQKIIKAFTEKGFTVEVYLASEESIKTGQQLYYTKQYIEEEEKKARIEEDKQQSTEEDIAELSQLVDEIEEATAERALFLIQKGAIKSNASDIHLQPEETFCRVRLRIDGILTEVFQLSVEAYDRILKQIKYLSHLKLNLSTVPQDGKYNFLVNDRKVDVRVSTLPSEQGETIVLRILDPKKGFMNFEELGFKDKALEWVQSAMRVPNGLILVTGPTGSGKTTTLYSMLNRLNTSERKIITLEDPIEYHLSGIVQSEVNKAQEYDFHSGLRSILRQDPDIVMIGEIRDHETAESAAQASLTGHIVLSTLHTNSAVQTIIRLKNIGLPPFMIAPALNIIVAQRLVRTLCDCAQPRDLSETENKELAKVLTDIQNRGIQTPPLPKQLMSPVGCQKCSKTGYQGQIGVIEVLNVDDEMRELILNDATSKQLLELAKKKGMLTMRENGTLMILNSITSISEVWRVTRG
jgi:type IV pilus assembly protein PilB